MKIAFLTHTTDYGGAAISLTTALKYAIEHNHFRMAGCAIVIPEGMGYGAYTWFAGRVPISHCIMPFSSVYRGASPRVRAQAYSLAKEGMAVSMFLFRYNHVLRREGFTHIHLNSLVFWSLLPFLPKDIIKIIHIREMVRDTSAGRLAIKTINKYADQIIAIGEQTARPFPTAVIVENPFDMAAARNLRKNKDSLKEKYHIPQDSFVVSDFSTIGPQKGSEKLIAILEAFPPHTGVHVLAAGGVASNGYDILKKLQQFPNFHFYPARSNMAGFYAMTDVVVRCEDYLPLGRTVFEGLYAGCLCLLPVRRGDSVREIREHLQRRILTYTAKSEESLISEIGWLSENRDFHSDFDKSGNLTESSEKFVAAIKTAKLRNGQ